MNQKKDQKKEFTAYFDDGTSYRFSLNENATQEEARRYVTMWNHLAGKKAKIDRIVG